MSDFPLFLAMQDMLYYSVIAICIITLPTLIVGLTLSIIQAATQVNEMTITFIPKLIVMFTLLIALSPWLMNKLVLLMRGYLMHLPTYIR
ncbi:MAG: flagellar biosynthetic protein FliQ [Gammaproteobacteria bacterium]|nr:flagellar biosynthetic protein FliQ [Gammaproteobacteria bacterium]